MEKQPKPTPAQHVEQAPKFEITLTYGGVLQQQTIKPGSVLNADPNRKLF